MSLAALSRLKAARNRHEARRARQDARDWQVKRRERTRQLIELGGLVVKAGIVELVDDDRATIYGALLWVADKLNSDEGSHALALWKRKGRHAFEAELSQRTETPVRTGTIGSGRHESVD